MAPLFSTSHKVPNNIQGYAPLKTTYYPKTGMCRILFPISCCENCPNKEACRAKQQKKNYAVHVSSAMAERAKYIEMILIIWITVLLTLY